MIAAMLTLAVALMFAAEIGWLMVDRSNQPNRPYRRRLIFFAGGGEPRFCA